MKETTIYLLAGIGVGMILVFIILGVISIVEPALFYTAKEYYRDQMLTFCDIAQNYVSDKYPDLFPCERWLVE